MKARNMILRMALCALSICAALAAACRKSPASTAAASQASPSATGQAQTPTVSPPENILSAADEIARIKSVPGLTEAAKALLIAQVPREVAQSKQEIKDRQELVLAPPPGWTPENVRRKLKLTLIPEKTMIRVNTHFRYRLEIQNVGREPIYFREDAPTFIKDGHLGTHWFEFYVAPPGGDETLVGNSFGVLFDHKPSEFHEYHFPDGMTTAEKDAAFERIKAENEERSVEKKARDGFSLSLRSGETLLTRPIPPLPNRFRNLDMDFGFGKPGTYRIKAAYDDRPLTPASKERAQATTRFVEAYFKNHPHAHVSPATKKILQSMTQGASPRKEQNEESERDSLGFVESNTVILEVVP